MKHGVQAVVLVGHGGVPRDFPPEDLKRLKQLEGQRRASGAPAGEEERELERRLRTWPRTAENDPYRDGLEALSRRLAPLLSGARLVVAYNEFCAPSVEEAIQELARQGVTAITVVPTMLTPGGSHSEREIPETLDRLRVIFPEIHIQYAWPFDLDAIAALLASHLSDFSRNASQ